MSKYVQLNLFNLDGSAASVFKIFPQEAHTGSLRDYIELAGGIVLEPDEEDPYAITLIDVEWFPKASPTYEINIPSDCFLSTFIYECYEWERVFDLNGYRFGESKYLPYDANEILRRVTSWSELKLLPVREALPLVLESPEFLYETPQKRYRLEVDQSTQPSIVSSSEQKETSEPVNLQNGTLEPGETEESEMNPSLNLTPVVSVSIGFDEELVLRRIQSEDDNASDIEEVPVPSSMEKKCRKASNESSPSAERKEKPQSSKSRKSSESTYKEIQSKKSRKRKISSANVESTEDNPREVNPPEQDLVHGEDIEVLVQTPPKSSIKKAFSVSKNKSPQKLQKHMTTPTREEITEDRQVKENGTEPSLKKIPKNKNKRRKKGGEQTQEVPEPAQLDADVDLSETNTDADLLPDQEHSETYESIQNTNSTNELPQSKKRKRKKVASSSSSISTIPIPTDISTIELPSSASSSNNTTEESSDNSDIVCIKTPSYKSRSRSDKAIPCTLCSSYCSSQFELVNHMRLHTGEQKFSCPYCSFLTNDKSTLTKHKKEHKDGKRLRCLKCVFSTGNSSQLEAHCKTHDEIKTYKCDSCDFNATTAYDLRVHGRTHQQNGST